MKIRTALLLIAATIAILALLGRCEPPTPSDNIGKGAGTYRADKP